MDSAQVEAAEEEIPFLDDLRQHATQVSGHGAHPRTMLSLADLMDMDGQDVRPEPLEERRKRRAMTR